MNNEQTTALALQEDFKAISDTHLKMRGSDNPEFKIQFLKTFSDLIFSQNDEMLEKLSKTKPASLLNAVFRATESGASFAKKEVSFIPYEIFKKEKVNGAEKKTATGEYEALVIFDINFQKQQILKLENCKRFYTAEVHEGVEVISDLTTGNFCFDGKNDVTKPTIGYYACFQAKDEQIYDLFMTCAEIVDRAKFSQQFKPDNYKQTGKSIHYEKIVVRNLLKLIPKISNELKSVLAWDENSEFSPYELVEDDKKSLESAKKELAEGVKGVKPIEQPAKIQEPEIVKESKESQEPAISDIQSEVQTFF
jgi:hypothetical protein